LASVDRFAVTAARIAGTLTWLRDEWENRVPQYVRDWANWDEDEKLSFVVEAGIREDYLHQAQRWAADGLLSTAQLSELRCIEEIAETSRKLLQPLLDED
jgi:hypothetical protein